MGGLALEEGRTNWKMLSICDCCKGLLAYLLVSSISVDIVDGLIS